MVTTVRSLGLTGIAGYEVAAECFLSGGLPAFDIVGLPDAAVREARERVRAAVKNCGAKFPVSRITVNLAPAGTKKAGTVYDLPIFVGLAVLLALCILNAAALNRRTNRWMDQADRIAQLAEQERWDQAREAMDALSADWESAQDFLHVVIHHETLDAAQVTLTRCRTLCRLRQGDDLLPELAQLRQQLQQLDELERLSLRNIL